MSSTTPMTTTPEPIDQAVLDYVDFVVGGHQTEWFDSLKMTMNQTDILIAANGRDMDIAWLVTCGALVFFMQCGFAMLEAGIVHPKNVTNILFKNMIDASIAAICFWCVGYAFAYGEDKEGIIGGNCWANECIHNNASGTWNISDTDLINEMNKAEPEFAIGSDGWEFWFYQWAFTGAAATIVAGSVAERTKLQAYFIYSLILSSFIYPVIVHWGWGYGWLSPWGAYPDEDGNARPIFNQDSSSNGLIDFAGSGVVHMVGGFSGLMGAIVVGPRKGRFEEDGSPAQLHDGNKTLQSLGAFILWFGWYGFNCGSSLALSGGAAQVAGKAAMTTTIAAAAAAIVSVVLSKIIQGNWDVSMGLNGILAGLVSITANCAVVNPWMAVIIGAVGAMVLHLGHYLILWFQVDDPCDACVIHGFCGVWGLWATGMFCTDKNVQYAGYPNVNDACGRGEQFGVQIVGSMMIMLWVIVTAGLLFLFINFTVGMRVSEEVEDAGLDTSEHGLQPYPGAGDDDDEGDDDEEEEEEDEDDK